MSAHEYPLPVFNTATSVCDDEKKKKPVLLQLKKKPSVYFGKKKILKQIKN
jgi:hypothetical protein